MTRLNTEVSWTRNYPFCKRIHTKDIFLKVILTRPTTRVSFLDDTLDITSALADFLKLKKV